MILNHIILDVSDQIAVLTVNRASKLNALNRETIAEIGEAIAFCENSRKVRGIIVTGSGEKAFVAGADISEFEQRSGAEAQLLSRTGHVVMNKIENLSKPVIAAVNGFALGGGLELALACHIRIASTNAKMGLPEVSLGLIPGYGGTQRLTQLVGKGKALEMILTGDFIDAKEAESWGLVNHVVEQAELLNYSKSLLQKMFSHSKSALANAILAVNEGVKNSVTGFETEIKLFGESFETDDAKEGIAAFIEKRKPNF